MHRTQLYLDEARYQYVVSLSRRNGKSLARIFRDLVDEHMRRNSEHIKEDPFFKVIGIGEGTGESVAENYEEGEAKDAC